MKTCILTVTNRANPQLMELHNLLLANKQQYADRHGYTLEVVSCSYDEIGCRLFFQYLENALMEYSRVMVVGVDVLFMNMRISLDSFEKYPLTISRERVQWWPINNDVCIWNRTDKPEKINALQLCKRISGDISIWIKYPWLWQIHLWNLIQDEPDIAKAVNIVETHLLGSTCHKGRSEFQLGEFLIHFLGIPIEKKIALAKEYLPLAGEPTWKPSA